LRRRRLSACWGRRQQVHMVGHQRVGVDGATPALRSLRQPAKIGPVVALGEKDGLAVMAALDDVRRDACVKEAGLAGHERRASGGGGDARNLTEMRERLKGSAPFSLDPFIFVQPPNLAISFLTPSFLKASCGCSAANAAAFIL
jgi:hypothetical protein